MRPFLLQEWISLLAYLLTFRHHLKGLWFYDWLCWGQLSTYFVIILKTWSMTTMFWCCGTYKGDQWPETTGITYSTGKTELPFFIWYRRWCAQGVNSVILYQDQCSPATGCQGMQGVVVLLQLHFHRLATTGLHSVALKLCAQSVLFNNWPPPLPTHLKLLLTNLNFLGLTAYLSDVSHLVVDLISDQGSWLCIWLGLH